MPESHSDLSSLSDLKIKDNVEKIIKPLSNDVRQKLLYVLSKGPRNYTEILELLDLESGSFYWHVKKMPALITQNQEKQYCLTDLGVKAFEFIFPEFSEQPVTELPAGIKKSLGYIERVLNAPLWLVIQQIVLILAASTMLYSLQGIAQQGSKIIYNPQLDIASAFSSIIITLTGMNALITVFLYLYYLVFNTYEGHRVKIPTKNIAKIFLFNYLFLSPILINGITTSILLIFLPGALEHTMLQFALSLLSIFLTIVLLTGVMVEELEFTLKDALIIVQILFYPFIIISYLFF